MATLVRTAFEQPAADGVRARMRHVLDALEAKFPDVAEHRDAAQADVPAFTVFPREIWRQELRIEVTRAGRRRRHHVADVRLDHGTSSNAASATVR